jgi:hypothetical protein
MQMYKNLIVELFHVYLLQAAGDFSEVVSSQARLHDGFSLSALFPQEISSSLK